MGMLYFPKHVRWVNNRRKHCRLSFHLESDKDSTSVLLLLRKLTANIHHFMIMMRHIVIGNVLKRKQSLIFERVSHDDYHLLLLIVGLMVI